MNKIIEYRLVAETNSCRMNELIGDFIEKGFQPFGGAGVAYLFDPTDEEVHTKYSQAMVKYE